MEENKHSDFAPSAFARRVACPASYKLEKDLPETTSADADEGTRLHAEMAEHFKNKTALTSDLCIKAKELFDLAVPSKDWVMDVERRLEYRLFPTEPEFFGTADLICRRGDEIVVIDWKFGRNPVEPAESNKQLALYAVAAFQEYFPCKANIEVVIIQPALERVSTGKYDADKLREVIRLWFDTKAACMAENAQCVCGDHCKYCKANIHGTCPAMRFACDSAITVASKCVPVAMMTIEELTDLREKCAMVAKLADAVDAQIKQLCRDNGGECGGFYIKTSTGTREISDVEAAKELLADKLTADDFMGASKVSLPKLAKAYAAKCDGVAKKDAEAEFYRIMEPVIVYGASRETLTERK